jgi:hypothetical protein
LEEEEAPFFFHLIMIPDDSSGFIDISLFFYHSIMEDTVMVSFKEVADEH